MSGVLNPHEPGITSTDDERIARARGWTDYDRESGLWSAPKPPDAGMRDGEDAEAERHDAALAEGDEQHRDEHGVYPEVNVDPLTGERSVDLESREPLPPLDDETDPASDETDPASDEAEHDEQPDHQPVAGEDGEPVADDEAPKTTARKRK